MADAGGTQTCKQLSNEGGLMKFIVTNTEVTSGETIPLDGAAGTGVPGLQVEDKIIVLGALNHTAETQLNASALTAAYDETAMHITVTESGKTDEKYSVVFLYIPQANREFGD